MKEQDIEGTYTMRSFITSIRIIMSRRMRWIGHVASIGAKRNAYRILVGKSKGKRPMGRPIRTWEDNIKLDLIEIE
jgi:hypothetical protein